jgi:hypothetical protein
LFLNCGASQRIAKAYRFTLTMPACVTVDVTRELRRSTDSTFGFPFASRAQPSEAYLFMASAHTTQQRLISRTSCIVGLVSPAGAVHGDVGHLFERQSADDNQITARHQDLRLSKNAVHNRCRIPDRDDARWISSRVQSKRKFKDGIEVLEAPENHAAWSRRVT